MSGYIQIAEIGAGAVFLAPKVLRKPAPETAPQPAVTPTPAPVAQPLSLDRLGCKLTPADGWQQSDDAAEQKAIPGDQVVVLRKQGSGRLPLFIIGRLSADVLGAVDPKTYPEAFVTALKKRLAKLQPAPKITQAGAFKELPKLFAIGQFVNAEGSFPELGATNGTGLFAAGASATGDVYVIAAFAPTGSPEESDVVRMVTSLEPLPQAAKAAEPAPSKPAEPPAAASTDGGPVKEPEAPAKADESKAPAKAEEGGAPAKADDGKPAESLDPKAPAKADESKPAEAPKAEGKEAPKTETP